MVEVPTPEKVARIVRWIILLFIAYVFLSNYFGPSKKPVTTASAGTVITKEKDCSKETPLRDFSFFAVPLIPTIAPALHVQDIKDGTGDGAQCGQHATLRYSYAIPDNANPKGQIIFSNLGAKDTPTTITIGDNDMPPGVERGILGAKPGGTRLLALSPQLGFAGVKDMHALKNSDQYKLPKAITDLQRQSMLTELSLISLSPIMPTSPMPLRVIDRKFGNGQEIYCGDRVRADITVWKIDGTKLFSTTDSHPLSFTPGRSQVPYGIEQAVIGMTVGAARSLIMPPAYAKALDDSASASAVIASNIFPANETVFVEIEILPTLEETPAPTLTKTPVVEPAKK